MVILDMCGYMSFGFWLVHKVQYTKFSTGYQVSDFSGNSHTKNFKAQTKRANITGLH